MTRTLLVLSALSLLATGCKRNPTTPAGASSSADASSIWGTDADGASTSSAYLTDAEAAEALRKNFQRVHFELDSARLSADARAALDENAAILQEHLSLRVEIQGHADARGTVDYNLALGQRRASAVVQALGQRGVPRSRLVTVSYGEERPLQAAANDSAWSANRRAEFRITHAGDAPVQGTTTL